MAKRSGAKAKKIHAKARAATKTTATPAAKTTATNVALDSEKKPARVAKTAAPEPAATAATEPAIKSDANALTRLHVWNGWLTALYAVQAAAILLLSVTKLFPVQVSYLVQDPLATQLAGHSVLASAVRHLFDLNLAYVVTVLLLIAAVAHLSAATICRNKYEADLRRGFNRIRWTQYAASASLMLVAIAVLSGVADLATLVLVFVLGTVMSLSGLLLELLKPDKSRSSRLAMLVGAIGGVAPWLVIGMYAWGAGANGGHVPGFVYGIYATMLVLFAATGVTAFLQHKRRGRLADYLYAERMYMVLGFVAKSLLAWQIFAGVLHP